MKKKTRVLVVDDHPIIRQGLSQLLNGEADMAVSGDVADANDAMRAIATLNPDVVVADISLEGVSGLELIKMIKGRYPKLPVLVLSMHDESLYAERALRAGARGYIMKHEAPEVIVTAIRRAIRGEIHVSESVASSLLDRVADGRREPRGTLVDSLSDRELEVFTLIGRGFGTRQVAEKLSLSVKTVETYREHIKDKLKIGNAAKLVRQAVAWVERERQG